jgi:hypothetical protein
MNLELILEDVELQDNHLNDNTFDVFFNQNSGKLHAMENGGEREFIYELTEPQDEIAKTHREDILNYCLSTVQPSDEVSLGDIFLHGKFVKLVK